MAKRQDKAEKRIKKQGQLVVRTANIAQSTREDAVALLSQPLVQSVRINPLRGEVSETIPKMRTLGWRGRPTWCENGYTLDDGFVQLRDSSLIDEGKLYIQNEASWVPVAALQARPGDRILDICAAPGGKTSHIAACMSNKGQIVANDNSRARLMKLQSNLARLGAHAEYTLYDATKLTRSITEPFDRILLDAPCSGEGLINLNDPRSLDSWSVAHIRRLATLQKQLIHQAWLLLKPGGRLVYSTCTMAPEENEAVIDWLLRRNLDAEVIESTTLLEGASTPILQWNDQAYDPRINRAIRLLPANGREAFFTCILEKHPANSTMA